MYYEDANTLVLTEVRGPTVGRKQVLTVKLVELRPKLFMVTWQEANKLSVTDIEDYEKGIVYANITSPKNVFETLTGRLTAVQT